MTLAVGLDLGNTWTNICIESNGKLKFAKIPSRIAFECPPGAISGKTGQELKPLAFVLIFEGKRLWFGQDTLGASGIQKLDLAKYDSGHISVLFRAVLYQWSKIHKADLANLPKLNVVSSMPPGLYQKANANKLAVAAFRKAFNRGQSHAKIKDDKTTVQIVTHFGGLQREAVAWGQKIPRKSQIILTVDLGGGTNDYAIFNGSNEPKKTFTDDNGLLYSYAAIDSVDPAGAELKIMRDKKSGLPHPHQIVSYFNEVERRIQMINLRLPKRIDCLYIIGGGAALMTPAIKATFAPLAPKVVIKDEYANAEANWHKGKAGSDD